MTHRGTLAAIQLSAPTPPSAAVGGPIAEVPPLPFIGTGAPACRDHPDVFEIAGTEGKPATLADRARIIAADREAHAICRRCPLLDGCREYALTTRQRWGTWGATNLPERLAWLIDNSKHSTDLREADVNDEERRRKFAEVPTIELFSPDATALSHSTVESPKRRPPKPAAHGNCPNCSTTAVRLLLSHHHLVWSDHYYVTWGGTTRPCLSSGVYLCEAPEPANAPYGAAPIECPHVATGKKTWRRNAKCT